MKTINFEQLYLFHQKIIQSTGGSDGVRDKSIIESALNRAFATFDGNDLYEGDIRKAVAIIFALNKILRIG